ncbi:restriction endonuclease [Thiococcus pfennigii]|uniref:restriction endonuclease n=1 Tax=Thiococcus pfennigii TaxID=1057 RepID=UPI0019054951|nr:restriction endonuclease [Thiococcus pfennigii]MBK1733639.1 restriction endonuclease [Thiococcus pfennigii]
MEESYHYPPEVLNLLVDTVPLLCRSKNDVLVFFRGAGVSESIMSDLSRRVSVDRENINKYEIARTVIQRINEKGDSELRTRREVVKRVVEFEDFSTCWPNDQLKAKGLIGELRRVVNVKDSFTRMSNERERERQERITAREKEIAEKRKKQEEIEKIKTDFYALFGLENEPQKRGKHLEKVLNALFSSYGILVKEDFKRVDPDGAGIIEQIDGVIELAGHIYLVEMKWVKEPIGVEKLSQHLVRIYGRHDARGLFIASEGYADSAITQCREALSQKTISLISLHEVIRMLERQGDFVQLLNRKIQAATVDKNPYLEILN